MLPVVPHPIIHLTVLPSPDQTLINPSRDSSHCLKSTCTNPFCPYLPINVRNVEEKTHLCNTSIDAACLLLHAPAAALGTDGAQLLFSFSKVSLFLKKRVVQTSSGGPEIGLPRSLLRLGSAWTRETRQHMRKITARWILIEPDFQWIVQIHKSDVPHLL